MRQFLDLPILLLFVLVAAAHSQSSTQLDTHSRARQEITSKALHPQSSTGKLSLAETIPVRAEMVTEFKKPISCDSDGNIYLPVDYEGLEGIHKISPKGEKLATYVATANPDFPQIDVAEYFVVSDGVVYQLVYPHELTRYIFIFKPEGTYKSAIRLSPGFVWMPNLLALFPSGQFLVSGLRYDADHSAAMLPFTGIFSADGSLLREVSLTDDEDLHDLAANGDSRVALTGVPQANRAITNGDIEMGDDGNVYLMRWTNPAIIYSISAGGAVVNRFEVDPGLPGYRPSAMHVRGGILAVLFVNTQNWDLIMKTVDLQGRDLGTFVQTTKDTKPEDRLGPAFACFNDNPRRFTFLGATDDGRLQLRIAQVR